MMQKVCSLDKKHSGLKFWKKNLIYFFWLDGVYNKFNRFISILVRANKARIRVFFRFARILDFFGPLKKCFATLASLT